MRSDQAAMRNAIARIIRAQFNIFPISQWELLHEHHKESWRLEADRFIARCWAAGLRIEVAHEPYRSRQYQTVADRAAILPGR